METEEATDIVVGLFSERGNAEDALEDLQEAGYTDRDISIITRDKAVGDKIQEKTGNDVATDTAAGAATGAVVGGIAGLLAGIGALAIPGVGPLLIGGPIASALGLTGVAATTATGTLTGAVAGGLIGALVSIGVPEDEAKRYEERIKSGDILIGVPVRDLEEYDAAAILRDNMAEEVRTISLVSSTRATGTGRADSGVDIES